MITRHLVKEQIISYKQNGHVILADILSEYYSPIRNNVHIYTLRIISSTIHNKGKIITESGKLLYNRAKIVQDVLPIRYIELTQDKMLRKKKAFKNKKPPREKWIKLR